MKRVFALCVLLFAGMYLLAETTLDRSEKPGIVRLRWATDANPARAVQTALFDRLNPPLQVTVDPSPAGDASKLIVQSATGTGPDIVDTSHESLETLVQAGVLLDLTPYAQSQGFDPSRTYPAIRESL